MTTSVTVWTSALTVDVQSRVTRIVCAIPEQAAAYDTISFASCDAQKAQKRIDDAFNRLVGMTTADPTLHILAIVPLFEATATEQIQLLYDACDATGHNVTLHAIGLSTSLRSIFSSQMDVEEAKDYSEEAVSLLKRLCNSDRFCMSYSLIDDYAANGAAIGFSIESLSRYIALFQTALLQDYHKVLSQSLLSAHPGENLTIGVASLSFDREAAARQLLGLGFLAALSNVGISDKDVDIQKAAHTAENLLRGISQRYPDLFERSIRPLIKEGDKMENEIAALAPAILDADIERMKTDILSLLKDDNLSLPEKEAVLALILGRDSENLRGIQYQHEGILLDDACEKPISLYVDAFNSCCKNVIGKSSLLPVRDDYDALKKPGYITIEGKKEKNPENEEAFNPLPEIKHLKQDIINTTSFLREKNEELRDLSNAEKQRKNFEEIRKQWHRPGGKFQDIEYKEQPLDDKYKPSPGLKLRDTVDLRKFFSPVRNQRNLGACSSFAAVAMYEAMMNRAGIEGHNQMSPAYLFYYSNILTGRPEGGSNFYEQLEILGKRGVCYEDFYTYDADMPDVKPSDHAENDAKAHRVIAAKQIPLTEGIDKAVALRRNHAILTAALSEGYPIGISLKIFDNFGEDGPFIMHPDDSPKAKEDGWHAMVIVGYSEDNGFYIVRNSWGKDFGDGGYCYVPSAYIDDPDYLNFACIITEISDATSENNPEVPTVIANFAATETDIRIAAIRNAIAISRIDLKKSQKLYSEYYKYYQRLMLLLTMPKIQNEIRAEAEHVQTLKCFEFDNRKSVLKDTFVEKLKSYKKYLQKAILTQGVLAVVFGLGWLALRQPLIGILSFSFVGLIALTVIGYKWWVRLKRRHLQEELECVVLENNKQTAKLFEMQLRFHVAGMWLCRFHKFSIDISNVYERLVSYNSSLRGWQESYTCKIGEFCPPEGQMFRSLDASPLLQVFFEENKSRIVKNINLIDLFFDYQVTPENIDVYHLEMQNAVMNAVNALMADFNIVNFLLGNTFKYLQPVNLHDEIGLLLRVGQPSFRNQTTYDTFPVRIILANIERGQENQWSSVVVPCFPMRPIELPFPNSTLLLLITIHPLRDNIA